ncbi:MAG TPA: hypothetical protein VMF65_15950 [Acidimicrobiales bacterium]|nr:hypothetical protein [Acidimicrobiales bacterium]
MDLLPTQVVRPLEEGAVRVDAGVVEIRRAAAARVGVVRDAVGLEPLVEHLVERHQPLPTRPRVSAGNS